MNLLKNPGFEMDWEVSRSHRAHLFPEDRIYEYGNIFTPPMWVTYFRHEDVFAQPEVRDARAPERIKSGEKGMLLFTFGRKHDAGFYQQVQAVPGQRFRLSAYAHAWSNHKDDNKPNDFPHPDDPLWSEGAGYQQIAWHSHDIPIPNGDPQNDAKGNVTFYVAIDPTGGTDPYADHVVWGEPYSIYNGYVQELIVEATAANNVVTVFLNSETEFPFKHNDAYWDDCALTVIEEPVTSDCDPRIPFVSTYFLASPNESAAQLIQKIEPIWDIYRWTIGGSADQAAHQPGTAECNIIASNPDDWTGSAGTLESFFETHYQHNDPVTIPVVHDTDYKLIGRAAAAGLRLERVTLKYPTNHYPPKVTSTFGVDRGTYTHNGLDLRASKAAYNDKMLAAMDGIVTVAGENPDEPWYGHQVRTRTDLGLGRFLHVRYGHMVEGSVAVEVGDQVVAGQFLGYPDSTGDSTGDHIHIDVRMTGPTIPISARLYVDPEMIMEWPTAPDPPPSNVAIYPKGAVGAFGMHRLGSHDGVNEALAAGWPLVKIVDDWGFINYAHQRAPATEIVLRKFLWHQGQYLDHPKGPEAGAHDYIVTIMPDILEHLVRYEIPRVWIESVNEEYSHDVNIIRRAAAFDAAFIREMSTINREYPEIDIHSVVFTAAVGNIQMIADPNGVQVWTEHMLPLAQLAYQSKAAFGPHCYHTGNSNDPEMFIRSARYFQNRWMEWDAWLRTHGIFLPWILGEVGSCQAWYENPNWIQFEALQGWNGLYSIERYAQELIHISKGWMDWNRNNGYMCLGGAIYQEGAIDEKWRSFGLEGPDLVYVVNAIANA